MIRFMRNIYLSAFLLLLILNSSVSCKTRHYRADISGIEVNIDIKRLEKDLFELNPDEISAAVPELREKFRGDRKSVV